MAKNKNNQNPETEELRLDDGAALENDSPADDRTDTADSREKDLSALLSEDGEEPADTASAEDMRADLDMLLKADFSDTLDLSAVPAADTDEEGTEDDISAYAPPAEEEPREKKAILGGLFARKNRQVPSEAAPDTAEESAEKTSEEPVLDTDELSFVTDSVPAAAAAGMGAEGMAEEEPAEARKSEDGRDADRDLRDRGAAAGGCQCGDGGCDCGK